MKLSQFKFDLPEELVAQYPKEFRDEARMMVVHRHTGEIEHKQFKDILQYYDDKDVFVFNDTKVFPARLYGNKEKTGAKIDVFLLREIIKEDCKWDVLVDPARKIRIGNKLFFGEDDSLVAEVVENTTSRGRVLRFLFDGSHEEFKRTLFELGQTPLPDCIKRPVEPEDAERYQTIYAKNEGAVAAPASGLHFSRELMKRLEIKGIRFAFLTVHTGLGNFRHIDVEDLTKHKMDSEQMIISPDAVETVNRAQEKRRRICAVGTSVMRALETALCTHGMITPYDHWSNKFIFPPYEFSVANSMVANFYFPESQLLMLTAAFGGYDLIMNAYKVAIEEKYSFGPYGDAMLII